MGSSPNHGVCIEVDDEFIRKSKCMSISDAAEELGGHAKPGVATSEQRRTRGVPVWQQKARDDSERRGSQGEQAASAPSAETEEGNGSGINN